MSAQGDSYPGAATAAVRAGIDNGPDAAGWRSHVRDDRALGFDVDDDADAHALAFGARPG